MNFVRLGALSISFLAARAVLAQADAGAAAGGGAAAMGSSGGAAAAGAGAGAAAAPGMTVKMVDGKGKPAGTATLTQTPHGLLIAVELQHLKPGAHAIHLHETAKCEPPFKTAGGHFNPGHKQHGFMVAEGPHGGDLPNLEVPASGSVKAELLASEVTLDGASGLLDKGAALVVHAKRDDYQSQPAGDAGDRVACGVIQKQGN